MHNHFSVAKLLWMRKARLKSTTSDDEKRLTLKSTANKEELFPIEPRDSVVVLVEDYEEEQDTRWMDERIKSDPGEL